MTPNSEIPGKGIQHEKVEEKKPSIRKGTVALLNQRYNTPQTSPITFHFEPYEYESSLQRLKNCTAIRASVEGKDIYIIDNLFTEEEGKALRAYSETATFSKESYATSDSRTGGEKPAQSMNNKERWNFFNRSPQGVQELYKLLGTWAKQINADIHTFPWELCDQDSCAPAVISNRVRQVSSQNMAKGKHEDYSPENGMAFSIPILYANKIESEKTCFDAPFVNGIKGKPWLISAMFYTTADNFLPEYGMGTVFFKKNNELALRAECRNMRLIIFEGDIIHGIEESHLPEGIDTWRVSYVFKLVANPKDESEPLRERFYHALSNFTKIRDAKS